MDRLTLRVQEGLAAARRLRRIEPLQCRGLRTGPIAEADGTRGARHRDAQPLPKDWLGSSELEFQSRPVFVDDTLDDESSRIEIKRASLRGLRKPQRCLAAQRARRKIDVRTPGQRVRPWLRVVRVGMRVVSRQARV